ncbi:hypothetical protein AVEN_73870-1 [Araneus ventricosus]|uniref:Uncharacterized protein n=1 Tax=Araneus ventricosus TaxID=182803 RepID=A0A4Y2G3F8_ARAVE|nr:hypothetical protein AVEN_73870-1 [Araneus ventricosus]
MEWSVRGNYCNSYFWREGEKAMERFYTSDYLSPFIGWDFAIAIIFFLHEGCATTTFIKYAGNVNPHTCNVNRHSCIVNRHTCNVNRHTCNVNPHTCNVNPHTCNVNHHTCNVNLHSCNLKLIHQIKSAALSIWQDIWDNGKTGRSTHDIVPRVSNKPVGWNREEIMFVTGHRSSPSYLHRFNLRTHNKCSCGEKEIQFTMPQNVGLPSPGNPKLQQCHLNYSG